MSNNVSMTRDVINSFDTRHQLRQVRRFVCRLTLVVIIGAVGETTMRAQGPFINPVCKESCALTDLACMTREQTCQLKLDAYYTYMAQLGAGVTLHRLPSLYVELLQKHYSGALTEVRFGFSDRQPGTKATTDCSVIYFSSGAPSNFVNKLKDGLLSTDQEFSLLLHELRHFSQCKIIGGRDSYAKMWFGHFTVSFLQQGTLDPKALHDGMPMEKDAISAASDFLKKTATIRDANGILVRPFTLTMFAGSTVIGSTLTAFADLPVPLIASVQGGSEPIRYLWSIKGPTDVFSKSMNGGRSDQKEIDWTPEREGTYSIALLVMQFNSGLVPVEKVINVKVLPRTKIVPATIN